MKHKPLSHLFSLIKLLLVLLLVHIVFTGCDPCRKVDCLNGGVCIDGDCQCPSNTVGENCEATNLQIVTIKYKSASYASIACPGASVTSMTIELLGDPNQLHITVDKDLSPVIESAEWFVAWKIDLDKEYSIDLIRDCQPSESVVISPKFTPRDYWNNSIEVENSFNISLNSSWELEAIFKDL